MVTLLPAATEIVAALGGAGHLVGISHECDYPGSVHGLPRVTSTPVDPSCSSAAIDAEVRRLREAGRPVIAVDAEQIRKLRPDLIITQGLCEVCAVSDGEVYRLAEAIHPAPRILSLAARDLGGIWRDIQDVGAALDRGDEAKELVLGLQGRLRRLRTSAVSPSPRVLCIEWLEPLYLAGHWVPELVAAAGGEDVGARAGSHSARREWAELPPLRPDHVVVMLCGLDMERARAELEALDHTEALALMRRVPTSILDGNQYTSRPGPRVVDGAEQIRAALTGVPAGEVERWLPAVRC
ncbi:MAG: iron complex transport system substrate-binding protein [Gemmatimonadales bacterium]|nr:iron complex transport system substrate-binding protein [Gemmatimonadales bacterium]